MAFTKKVIGTTKGGGVLVRYTEQSAANAPLNDSIPAPGAIWRLVSASVAYSGVPTQTGASISLVSGAGAAFNTVLRAGTANAQYTNYPDESQGEAADAAGPLFGGDDALSVSAPAGGAGITSAATIYIEVQ